MTEAVDSTGCNNFTGRPYENIVFVYVSAPLGNVSVVERECGLNYHIRVSWEVNNYDAT